MCTSNLSWRAARANRCIHRRRSACCPRYHHVKKRVSGLKQHQLQTPKRACAVIQTPRIGRVWRPYCIAAALAEAKHRRPVHFHPAPCRHPGRAPPWRPAMLGTWRLFSERPRNHGALKYWRKCRPKRYGDRIDIVPVALLTSARNRR